MNNLLVMRASNVHEKMIRSFLFTHYWPREPSITALWMSACSKYVDVLNDKYASFGFRYIAFEKLRRTNELKMVGVLVGNKVFPWSAEELEQWTLLTDSPPEQTHMFFRAHVLRSSNLFATYNCSYVYELEVLATAGEVMGLGVGTELVKFALNDAYDQRIPVTSLVATSHYAAKICKKVGMTRVWSCDYRDMVDHKGNPVFFPRAPHTSVSVYAIRTEKRL
ncbi:uncharacterized protein LOC113235202 [Hyposmocoma kahamanoa]|uniref:uncharacterized protein LOC113235202 n=1 Tax=Hyposmocoma kahamanoa TaxID=1477025 RepID=UPI000E6D98C1|nr:uncharacterized protein LOC113235202 [Hyposmocoma kahamanoa]